MTDRLVIFDCDGVLVDSEPISFAVLREMLAEEGHELSESRAYRQYLGKSAATVSTLIADEFDIVMTEDRVALLRDRLYARLAAELKPVTGVAEMLAGLDNPACVASSSQPERIRLSLGRTGLIDYFEPHIFSATMVKNGKPAPDLFLHAAEAMGFGPASCVVVEDSPAGILAAKAAGMTVFAFTGASHAALAGLRDTIESLDPTLVFDDITRLPALLAGLDA